MIHCHACLEQAMAYRKVELVRSNLVSFSPGRLCSFGSAKGRHYHTFLIKHQMTSEMKNYALFYTTKQPDSPSHSVKHSEKSTFALTFFPFQDNSTFQILIGLFLSINTLRSILFSQYKKIHSSHIPLRRNSAKSLKFVSYLYILLQGVDFDAF